MKQHKTHRQMGLFDELIVDNFAGGGGASTGIEAAIGRPIDVAVNHDPEAILMHTANHPFTKHYLEDVFDVDPLEVAGGRPVGLCWFSPDCKHFSKAKGGSVKRSKKIRGLAWVALKWASKVRPRVIILENVEEFLTWGPLGDDGIPIKERKGETFQLFRSHFEALGYKFEYKVLSACDYGAPTTRKRLFMIARCDGQPIVWPAPTHSKGGKVPGTKPWRTAADWSIPCQSIFERKKPLADKTMARIARGVIKFVLENNKPFIVSCNHGDKTKDPKFRGVDLDDPMCTITSSRDAYGLCIPTLVQIGYGEHSKQKPRVPGLDKPLGTVMAEGIKHAVAVATLIRQNGGNTKLAGRLPSDPLSTVTAKDQNSLVLVNLARHFGTGDGADLNDPAPTVMSGGGGKTSAIYTFLMKYYGKGEGSELGSPVPVLTTKDRLAIITIHEIDYIIVDIGMRMLKPHEIFAAQGFPEDYVIAPMVAEKNKPLSQTAQVRMCGNSVCPPLAEALVRANYTELKTKRRKRA